MYGMDYYEESEIDVSEYPEHKDYRISPMIYTPNKRCYIGYQPVMFVPPPLAPDEVFRPITNYVCPRVMENRYLISNYGRVWDNMAHSLMTYCYSKSFDCNGFNISIPNLFLRYHDANDSTKIISRQTKMHRVVMLTFNHFKGCEKLKVITKDGDVTNIALYNLEYVERVNCNWIHDRLEAFKKDNKYMRASAQDFHNVCSLLQQGYSEAEIFNMTLYPMTFSNLVRSGYIKNEITMQYNFIKRKDIKNTNFKMSEEVMNDICRSIVNGESTVSIADRLNVSQYMVQQIKYGHWYRQHSRQFGIPLQRDIETSQYYASRADLLKNKENNKMF